MGKQLFQKLKSPRLSYILDETIPSVMITSKYKKRLQYQPNLFYLTEVMLDISDLPFVQNKDYQYSVSCLDILK